MAVSSSAQRGGFINRPRKRGEEGGFRPHRDVSTAPYEVPEKHNGKRCKQNQQAALKQRVSAGVGVAVTGSQEWGRVFLCPGLSCMCTLAY